MSFVCVCPLCGHLHNVCGPCKPVALSLTLPKVFGFCLIVCVCVCVCVCVSLSVCDCAFFLLAGPSLVFLPTPGFCP